MAAAVVTSAIFGGGVATAGTLGQPSRNATTGTAYYVDCSVPTAGDGSKDLPFNSLSSVGDLKLAPGDQVLFKRGTTCDGMFAPQPGSSGTASAPILIGAYGKKHAVLPTISAGGATTAAVLLADTSHIVIQDLQLTNAGDSNGINRGLYFTATQPVTAITIRNLQIHDVDSTDVFDDNAKTGGGIIGMALTATGRFTDVLIEHNHIHDVSRQGIEIRGTTQNSTRTPADMPWPAASTGIVIRHNLLERLHGDGIVPRGTDGALVEHNVVREGNLAGQGSSSINPVDIGDRKCAAGIWTWDANNTLIQYNEVSHMRYNQGGDPETNNGCDGEGFDVDGSQDGTVIQYNYSHDNAGGFLLLCTSGGSPTHRADVRYNLSVDDALTFIPAPCQPFGDPANNNLNGVRVYNNTIVAKTPRVALERNELTPFLVPHYYGTMEFRNNIVYAADAQNHKFHCGLFCTNNVFFNMPVPPTAMNSITEDPLFVDPTRRGGVEIAGAFRLQGNSPAIRAGVVVPPAVPRITPFDFFGLPIHNPPTIGFAEAAPTP